jgi:hypothetical protein
MLLAAATHERRNMARGPSHDSRPRRSLKEAPKRTPQNRSEALAPVILKIGGGRGDYFRALFERSFAQFQQLCWLRIKPVVDRRPGDDSAEFNGAELHRALDRMLGQLSESLTVNSEDPVERLGIPDRLCTVLARGRIHTVKDLEMLTFAELRSVYGVGLHSAGVIKAAMEFHGKRLRDEAALMRAAA